MRKYYLILAAMLLLLADPTAALGDNSSSEMIKREIAASVNQAGEIYQVIVPEEPLAFDTTLNWYLTINKKTLVTEKTPAYLSIETYGSGKNTASRYQESASNSMEIPKGTRLKVTIHAGEYTRLFMRGGAEVGLKMVYNEAVVKYTQSDKPFTFNFEIAGPIGFTGWRWDWGSGRGASGSKVTYGFEGEGRKIVIVEGNGEKTSGETFSRKYCFELEVPPLIELNPVAQPLQGPAELEVKVKAEPKVNYGQKAVLSWDFGNGIELTGTEAGNVYTIPGNYCLVLNAKVGETAFQRSWTVEVTPIAIDPNPTVTPLTGPVPLAVNAAVNPVVSGAPTQIVYQWSCGGQVFEGPAVKLNFTEPGNYPVILKTVDKLHPDMAIPDQAFIVKAQPPLLTMKPTVSLNKGYTPLECRFDPNLTVNGSPVELVYYWEFGDGEIGFLEKPVHTYKKAGVYQVRLVVKDRLHPGNAATSELKMEVLPPELKPEASADVSTGLVPLRVAFSAQAAVIGSPCEPIYYWDFGDGTTGIEPNPTHIYNTEGTFLVTCEARDRLNPGSVSGKTTLQVTTKLPKLRLTVALNPVSGPAPLTVTGEAFPEKEGGAANAKLRVEWNFGDGIKADGTEMTHTYNTAGSYEVTVTVYDEELGVSEKKTVKVTVR